jgi:hypothetical protein
MTVPLPLPRALVRLNAAVVRQAGRTDGTAPPTLDRWTERAGAATVSDLIARGYACRTAAGTLVPSDAGRALARASGNERPLPEPAPEAGPRIDDQESPLAWLARRKGPGGAPLIATAQFAAGERLRTDFTLAGLTPRVTASWSVGATGGRRGAASDAALFTDMRLAARQRLAHTLDAVGPEFSGVLLDVCCFLKGLEQVESERRWPARSAKVVLVLGLDRLARHYGLSETARGPERGHVRTWLADGETFTVAGG